MRGITIRQPFAELVAQGQKTTENRTGGTSYRGLLAIHAGMTFAPEAGDDPAVRERYGRPRAEDFDDYGAIIALARLVDVHVSQPAGPGGAACCAPWGYGTARTGPHGDDVRRYRHLIVADPVRLPVPIPWRGQLGLWRVPPDLAAQVAAAAAVAAAPVPRREPP